MRRLCIISTVEQQIIENVVGSMDLKTVIFYLFILLHMLSIQICCFIVSVSHRKHEKADYVTDYTSVRNREGCIIILTVEQLKYERTLNFT